MVPSLVKSQRECSQPTQLQLQLILQQLRHLHNQLTRDSNSMATLQESLTPPPLDAVPASAVATLIAYQARSQEVIPPHGWLERRPCAARMMPVSPQLSKTLLSHGPAPSATIPIPCLPSACAPLPRLDAAVPTLP